MKGIVVFVICGILIGVTNGLDFPKYRLPNNVVALSYDIKIQPNILSNSFYGEVDIYVELQQYIRYIALNMKDLIIGRLILDNSYADFTVDENKEMMFIYRKDSNYIDPGEHLIHMEYTGIIRNDSIGLFKSVIQSDGNDFVSLATMFSAPYARMVFPCLDEPAFKSRFTIRLIAPDDGFTALSNMEEIRSLKAKKGKIIDFQTTPLISPYLVCFVLTQYNHKSSSYTSVDGRTIPLRFFMLDEYLDQADFYLHVAKYALEFFENYTNMTYPVPKLDFIEVPGFIYEGMENIGLVILTHNSVSFNSSRGYIKVDQQRNAVQLIVHEIAHMWFGDIVTPEWYNDLWLAEGFAQFMEIEATNNPSWHLGELDNILRKDFSYYMDDAPIVNFPNNNDQVEKQFSDIIYIKGSAVLKMLQKAMGDSKFQNGIQKFLRDFSMNSASTGDLINTMQSSAPSIHLRGFLETWLHQDGFPLLTVSRKNDDYILRQRSFQMNPNSSSIFGRNWTIPVSFIYSQNTSSAQHTWFDKDADTLSIPMFNSRWIKLNHNAEGFYRVLYSEKMYQQLLDDFEELNEADQANLIQETNHLFWENLIPCETTLKFIGKLKNNNRILPSLASFQFIQRVMKLFQNHLSVRSKLREYFIRTFRYLYEKLNWRLEPTERFSVRYTRPFLLDTLCLPHIAYEKCIEDAKRVKQQDGEIHEDLLHVWEKMQMMENRSDVINSNEITNSNSSLGVKDSKSQSFLSKCGTWIKMNL